MPSIVRSGIEIHFVETGSGPPVLLGHSFMCSIAMWAPQLPRLAERYRVVAVDARGHGASGTADQPYTLYDGMEDSLAVLDALGIERAVWAGLSMGGMVALRAALVHPDRVSGLVLLDADAGTADWRATIEHTALGVLARLVGVRPVLPQVAKIMFGETTLRTKPDLVAEWTRRFAALHVPSILRGVRVISQRDDLFPRLGRIDVPALVVVGAEDRALPPARSRRLAAALPRAKLIEIPAAGHLSALEQPDAVTRAMLEFLDGLHVPADASASP